MLHHGRNSTRGGLRNWVILLAILGLAGYVYRVELAKLFEVENTLANPRGAIQVFSEALINHNEPQVINLCRPDKTAIGVRAMKQLEQVTAAKKMSTPDPDKLQIHMGRVGKAEPGRIIHAKVVFIGGRNDPGANMNVSIEFMQSGNWMVIDASVTPID